MKKVFKILFIVILIAIFFLRNLSFTAYNIRPVDEWFICDYYWQQQIQRVYGEKFNLEQYRMSEPSWLKYKFEITDENDIKEAAYIIAVTLKYTFDNVETISRDMLGYTITYDGWPIYTIYEDREGVLELRNQDEEDIYQYIYNEIYEYTQTMRLY